MDFVLWVCRVMHIISVTVWIGGLIFLNAVLNPVLQHQGMHSGILALSVTRRFLPFLWFSLWALLTTGLLLMLLSPRFLWFDYSTDWSKLLAAKEFFFLLLAGLSWQIRHVVTKLERAIKEENRDAEGWSLTLQKLLRRSIFFGLLSILCAAWMAIV